MAAKKNHKKIQSYNKTEVFAGVATLGMGGCNEPLQPGFKFSPWLFAPCHLVCLSELKIKITKEEKRMNMLGYIHLFSAFYL